jgi:hypothetical protein
MDLSFLRPLYDRPGPWASVYLDASHDTEDAARAVALRWRAAAERLTEQGADRPTVEALEAAVTGQPAGPGRCGLAAFAAGGEVVLLETLAQPPRTSLASVDALPHAMPLVAERGERIAWLRVLVDRTGADLAATAAGGVARTERVSGGNQYPIRKVSPGGWSQARYQREAETTWERNTAEVADAVARLAGQTGAEILVVAGDVHARQLLVEQLPERWQARVVLTDVGSRAPGADPAPLDEATASAVVDLAARHTADLIDRYQQQRGREEAAGRGLDSVVAALQRAQVDTVLLADDPSSTARLWVGPRPTDLAVTFDELRAMGVEQPQRVRADAALLRALAGTEANLVLVDPEQVDLDGGIGALLRYVDAATRRG